MILQVYTSLISSVDDKTLESVCFVRSQASSLNFYLPYHHSFYLYLLYCASPEMQKSVGGSAGLLSVFSLYWKPDEAGTALFVRAAYGTHALYNPAAKPMMSVQGLRR